MKKLFKPFALLLLSVSLAVAAPNPQSFKVSMYNVHDTHSLKVFVEKQKGDVLKVEIKDKDGKVLLTQFSNKKSQKAAYCFDLSGLESGDYQLEISNKNEVFVKDLNLVTSEKVIEVEKKIIL